MVCNGREKSASEALARQTEHWAINGLHEQVSMLDRLLNELCGISRIREDGFVFGTIKILATACFCLESTTSRFCDLVQN